MSSSVGGRDSRHALLFESDFCKEDGIGRAPEKRGPCCNPSTTWNHYKYNQDGIPREVRDNVVDDCPVEESSKAQPKKGARNTSKVVLSTLSKVGRKVVLKTYDPIRP